MGVIDAHTYCVHLIIVVALTLLAIILNHPVLLHFRRNLTIAHQFQNLCRRVLFVAILGPLLYAALY